MICVYNVYFVISFAVTAANADEKSTEKAVSPSPRPE